jgi:short-subunit dehydrogenase
MKYVLITGVSSGLGYAMTKALIQDNSYFVFGSVRQEKDGEILKQKFGELFHPLVFDVTNPVGFQKAVEETKIVLAGKEIFALINNAGIAYHGPLELFPIDQLKYQYEVNVIGVVRTLQAFLPIMSQNTHNEISSKIINIGSVSGMITRPFFGPYASSKHALRSLSDAMRRELVLKGVQVVLLEPGAMKSEIWDKAKKDGQYYEGTIYSEFYKKKDQMLDQIIESSMSTSSLTQLLLQILKRDKNKSRYLIYKRKWYFRFLLSLPDRVLDRIILKRMKKTKYL